MAYLLLGLFGFLGLLILGNWFIKADPKELLRIFKWLTVAGLLSVIIFLAVTGRLVWAFGGLIALLPWVWRLITVARAAKSIHGMMNGDKSPPPADIGPMDRSRALQVLGLEDGCSKDDINEAWKRLMATHHPDHGGTDYLAAEINRARDVLLDDG